MIQEGTRRESAWVMYGLVLVGVISRLIPHPWNATPVMAIALFAGTYLSKRWAIVVPLAIVALSDILIGWHDTIPFTWGAFVLTGMIAWRIRPRPSAARILISSLAGSMLFFVITNFGVWFTQALYPKTLEGLWQCYVAAVPFFRNTVLGDLLYVGTLFGGYAAAASLLLARSTAHSA